MAKDESQTGGKPSVRARKGVEVHVRHAEKPQRDKKKPVADARAAKPVSKKPDVERKPKPRSRTVFIEPSQPSAGSEAAPEPAPQVEAKPAETSPDARQDAASPESTTETAGAADPDQRIAAHPAPGEDAAGGAGGKSEGTRPGSFSERLAKDGPAHQGEPRKRWKVRLAIGIVAAVVVALAVTAAVFSWNRWARYDDRADLQGVWYAYGTAVPVTFTENSIVFDENTAYAYEVDPEAKTIRYAIGDMEGQGRYWFNGDRSVLIITDGDGYSKWGTVFEDVGHWAHDLFNGASLPVTEQSIAFSRSAMSDGPLTVEPEPSPSEELSGSASGEGETPGETQPEGEQPEEASGENPSEEPTTDDGDGKEAMKELPISDIVLEDDTPRWGQ